MAGTVSIASSTAGSAGAGALVVTGGLATGAASYFGGAVTSSTTLGVGGANAPWYNTGAISVGGWLDLGNGDGGASTRILSNAYAAGSGDWRSRQGAFGSLAIQLEPNLQQIIFYTAPAVSQNAALTFTSRVAISTTGLAVTGALSTTGAATFAGAVNVAGVLYGAGTNTWALQSVGASGALVAGGWLYGINNGFNITPNGAGVAGATFMLAAFDGTGYREMLSTANVASGASTLRLAGYGGPTTVGGTLGVAGAATFGGAVEITGATTLNNDVYQTALKKFYVDSGSNTYFHENSSDSFQIVTGGTVASTLTAGSVLFNGTVIAPAATASLAPLRIPHGTVAPTSPTDGDMWTTTAGLFIRINGVTKTVTLT